MPFLQPTIFTLTADDGPPIVTLHFNQTSPVTAGPLTITAEFSEPLSSIPKILVDQPGSGGMEAPEFMTGSGTVWQYTYQVPCSDGSAFIDGMLNIEISNAFDYSGNENPQLFNSVSAVDTSQCGSGKIIGAEYFFDEDPGEGSGMPLPPSDGSFDSQEETVNLSGIESSGLKIGSHTLYVRFKKRGRHLGPGSTHVL